MKKLTVISTALVAGLLCAASAQAQVISVQLAPYNQLNGTNYTYQNLTAGEGIYDLDNWNSLKTNGGGAGSITAGTPYGDPALFTSGPSSVASAIGVSVSYNRADGTGSTGANMPTDTPFYVSTGSGQMNLAGGGITEDGGTLDVKVNGLVSTDTYTLIAYVSGLYYGGPEAEWSVGNQHYFVDNTNGTGLSSWVQGTSTTSAGAFASNYVEFTGLTGITSLDLDGVGVSGGQAALMGFQLVQSAAVPEPSTVWLFALGFAGLLFQTQRKRLAKL